MKNIKKITLLIAFLNMQSLFASNYFVDGAINTNSNSGLNENDPFKTISQAIAIVEAGDTVNIKGYDNIYYDEVLNLNNLVGYDDAKITFKSYGGKMAIIRGCRYTNPCTISPDENQGKGQINIKGSKHIVIDSLKIIESAYAGVFIGDFSYEGYYSGNTLTSISSSNINIKNCIIDNTYSSGIGVWTSTDINISDNNITQACNGGGQECITLAHTKDSVVKGNHISENGGVTEVKRGTLGGEGIDIKHGSQNIKVFGNTVKNLVNRTGIYVDGWGQERDDNGNPIGPKTVTKEIKIYNNIVDNCTEAGIAIASERNGKLTDVLVFNNIVSNNLYGGIELGGWKEANRTDFVESENISNIKIYNNTVYKNGVNDFAGGIVISKNEIEDIFIFNNIISENGGYQIDYDAANVSNVDGILYDKVFINRNIMYRDENYEDMTKLYNFDEDEDMWSDTVTAINWIENPNLNNNFEAQSNIIEKTAYVVIFNDGEELYDGYASLDIWGNERSKDCIDMGAIQVSNCL